MPSLARFPPEPARREDTVDVLYGIPVVDPYRWLEDGENEEVRQWSGRQTELTEALLSTRPGCEALAQRLESLLRIGWVEPPVVVGSARGEGRYFYRRQGPNEDQPILYVRDGPFGEDRTLIDPNRMSDDGTTSLDWWAPSRDGRLLAYAISQGGNEDSTLRVRDLATGRDLPETEVISRARYASFAWLPDGSGFYYSRYPEKGSVPAGEEVYHRKIHLHTVGMPPEKDPIVFGQGRPMTDTPSIDLSPNGRWLVASVHMGWSRREAHLSDRASPAGAHSFFPIAVPEGDAFYEAMPYDDHLLVRTNDRAPTYALYRVDPERLARENWTLVIEAGEDVLASFVEVRGEIIACFNHDAHSVLRRFSAKGEPLDDVPLPMFGTVTNLRGEADGHEVFFDFSSFAVPVRVYRLDLETNAISLWAEVKAPIDPDEFVVRQERAISKDGTPVPMFIVHKKGLAIDGTAPTLINGYGGFNISQTPTWTGGRYALLERGGVSVTANLRGGGEYGERWHRDGMLERKQNVFDDLYAVAEHLIERRVTCAERLAISGGSNGGLLVGVAITQRPELFRAAVCLVPLLDMVRYHRFLIAKLWIPEYGSADEPEQFAWLHAYSPYHHVVPGTRYPATLFAAAEGDSRVDPLHARKMAALLQSCSSEADRPVLLRIESKAGHGAGKPISKRVREATLIYAFLFWQLGLEGA